MRVSSPLLSLTVTCVNKRCVHCTHTYNRMETVGGSRPRPGPARAAHTHGGQVAQAERDEQVHRHEGEVRPTHLLTAQRIRGFGV